MSLHCKLVPVQYQEYDVNLFLIIFPCMKLHYKLVPVQYQEYAHGLLDKRQSTIHIDGTTTGGWSVWN